MSGKSSLKAALLALQFLTVITLVPGLRASRDELRASLSFFPLVGLLIGGLASILIWVLSDTASSLLTGVLVTVFLAAITRGLHLDGLADTADAVASSAPAPRALEIMKDSCSGALGVTAIVCVLMVKAASSALLLDQGQWKWFLLLPSLSRFGLNCLASVTSYARAEGGLGSPFCGPETRACLVIAGLTALAAAWFLEGVIGLAFVFAAALWSLAVARWAQARFGGVTGDILGAHLEVTETLLFLAASVLAKG